MKRTVGTIGVLTLAGTALAGVVQLDIARRGTPDLLSRRSDTFTSNLMNNVSAGAYVTTVEVGTPPQAVTLQLDTGSSDTWVAASNASVCSNGGCFYGSFDASNSSSFQVVDPSAFNISYLDGTGASGDYFTDVFTIGSTTLKTLTMGLGVNTDNPYGLVGIGYPAIEAIDPKFRNSTSIYPNLPHELVNEGIIPTVAYSLWLNDLDASSGTILFGGIDTEKYQGELTRLRLYPSTNPNNVTEFVVALSSVTAVSPSGSDKMGSTAFPMPVLLDSGSSFTKLPQDLVNEIYNEVDATFDSNGNPLVACTQSSSKSYFSFGFGGPNGAVVNVSMSELVIPGAVGKLSGGSNSGEDACLFGIFPVDSKASTQDLILGDIFLRSAYVVYDLVNNEVGMAPTIFNATNSNVVAFASSGAPIPSSTPAPSQGDADLQKAAVTATLKGYGASKGFMNSASGVGRQVIGPAVLASCVTIAIGSFGLL